MKSETADYQRQKFLPPLASPEHYLWRSVVFQAIQDATAIIRMKDRDKLRDAKKYRDEARLWLLRDRKDFYTICALAGLDGDAVRDRARCLSRKEWVVDQPIRLGDTI